MELANLISPEIAWKVAGWAVAAATTMGTMLYKGIWKRINQIAEDREDDRSDLDRLIGACGVNHPRQPTWDGVERRKVKRAEKDAD